MKFQIYGLGLLLSLAGPVVAGEHESQNMKQQPKFQEYSDSESKRYTFQNYISDLKESAHREVFQSGNLVLQPAFKRDQKYKPVNPVVISW